MPLRLQRGREAGPSGLGAPTQGRENQPAVTGGEHHRRRRHGEPERDEEVREGIVTHHLGPAAGPTPCSATRDTTPTPTATSSSPADPARHLLQGITEHTAAGRSACGHAPGRGAGDHWAAGPEGGGGKLRVKWTWRMPPGRRRGHAHAPRSLSIPGCTRESGAAKIVYTTSRDAITRAATADLARILAEGIVGSRADRTQGCGQRVVVAHRAEHEHLRTVSAYRPAQAFASAQVFAQTPTANKFVNWKRRP